MTCPSTCSSTGIARVRLGRRCYLIGSVIFLSLWSCTDEATQPIYEPFFFVDRVPASGARVTQDELESLRAGGYLASYVSLGYETRPSLTPPLPSLLTFAVAVPQHPTLRFAIAASGLGKENGSLKVRFIVSLSSETGETRLFEETIGAHRQDRWWDRQVDLSRWSGQDVRISFETQAVETTVVPNGATDNIYTLWGSPVVDKIDAGAERPNLILVSIDCLRADHVGVYGYTKPTTPFIDEFAKDAVVFRRAVSASSWTIPSHMSMFTGLPPMLHGVNDSPDNFWAGRARKLAPSIPYLAELLSRRGYETVGVVSSSPMSPAYGFERGFGVYRLHAPHAGGVVDSALEFARHARGRSMFLFVHLIDPHWPYLPMVEFRRYAKEFIDRFGPRPPEISELQKRLSGKSDGARPDDAEHVITLYDAAIAYVDRELNRFFGELKKLELYDNSLVLLTGDHGEAFYDHATWGHAKSLYDELTHVPLIVKWPGGSLRGVVESPVTHVDFFPTLLEEAGISPPPTEGLSLRTQVERARESLSSRAIVTDASWEDRSRQETMLSVRTGDLKYIAVLPYAPIVELSLQTIIREELYDLSRDPKEENNLIGKASVDPAPFREQLQAYLDVAKKFRSEHQGEAISIDEDVRRSLEALGYVNR